MLPAAPPRPDPPRPETITWLRESLSDDVQALQRLLQREQPLWEDFDPSVAFTSG